MSLEEVKIMLECFENNDVLIRFNSEVMPDILIKKSKVSREKLGGEARALLAASVTECLISWLTFLLNKARIKVKSLQAITTVTTGLDESEQNVVKEINIKVDVKIDGEDDSYQRFERIKNLLLRQGCLISRSLEKGIKVSFKFFTGE